MIRVAAVDLGASSGRVMVGEVGPERLALQPVARFPNLPVALPSGLHWNLVGLYQQLLAGLRVATTAGPLVSVGIDSWAVDYGLLREGSLLGVPFAYRDEQRGLDGPARVHAAISRPALYERNGLQYLPFNTLYQLAADPFAELADELLLIPDLLGYWLTGQLRTERTNASTTGLLSPLTGDWDAELTRRIGLSPSLFGQLVSPGETVGLIAADIGQHSIGQHGIPLVAVASHDTASAVVGAPLEGRNAAYISLGTWGLVGLELDAPVLTDAAREANFTNEGGIDGTTRLLTNVMGTWLLSELLRTWAATGSAESLQSLLVAAADVPEPQVVEFDVQDPRFVAPGDMEARIRDWCTERGLEPPTSRPPLVASIVLSLAAAYAAALRKAESLSGSSVEVVHVVGGGVQNALLCQAIADRSGVRVVAGPVEATAIGNLLVQARTAGAVDPDLASMRKLVRATQDLVSYLPR